MEFQKISSDIFRLCPIANDIAYNAKLYVADSMYHKADQDTLMGEKCFYEIHQIINNIDFKADQGQSFYNQEIEKAFTINEWHGEVKAIPELDLKCDYRKEIYQVEIEFGNARSYYQDYIKFMLSYFSQQIDVGILVTPTINFANILCGIGKQKAIKKGRKTYSGMMHFEKAFREFHYLKPIFDMPIVILGIDIYPE